MTIKTSTALRNAMMDTGSFRDVMALGFIKIYAGAVPADADAALAGATLLCTVSVNSTGTGLSMDTTASAGVITKDPSDIWSGVNAATGVATFYRFVTPADDGTLSTSQERVQGLVATAGADLNLSSTSLVSAATQTIDFYSIALPTA